MFQPVRKKRIYEEIVSKIKGMIEEGRLRSGDQLPTERELSEAFRVSRSSVREALRALESQGLLASRQGNGTFVTQQPSELIVADLASAILNEKDYKAELFEMRRLIEPQLAFLAAERATPDDIAEMERLLENQEDCISRGEPGADLDRTFHDLLADATKNTILIRTMETIMESLAESRDKYLQTEGRPEISLAGHREILSAVRAGDRELAARIMREHLEDVEDSLYKDLGLEALEGRGLDGRGGFVSLRVGRGEDDGDKVF